MTTRSTRPRHTSSFEDCHLPISLRPDRRAYGPVVSLAGTVDGGTGADTLVGDNAARTFTVTGANAGTVSTLLPAGFAGVENLRGGRAADEFLFRGGSLGGLDVTAGFVGPVAARGNAKADLSGDVLLSTFRLTGNDGTAKRYGLKSLTAEGTVQGTTFDVQEGSVGAVSVGRFIDSNLYLDYTPSAFDAPSGFDGTAAFRVEKFTTTAATIGDSDDPLNWSFAGSRIAAHTIGPVTLSGLKTANPGDPFGIKFRATAGPVRVKTSDSAAVPRTPSWPRRRRRRRSRTSSISWTCNAISRRAAP